MVLGLTAIAQTVVFIASGSIALLANLIHNFGDALTALPLGIAFALHSQVAERRAGLAVVTAIFISACVAGVEAVGRLCGRFAGAATTESPQNTDETADADSPCFGVFACVRCCSWFSNQSGRTVRVGLNKGDLGFCG